MYKKMNSNIHRITVRTLANLPICSVNTKCRAAWKESNATRKARPVKQRMCLEARREGYTVQRSNMRFHTNSNLWLMVDANVLTMTLQLLCIVKVLCHLFFFIPFNKFIQQYWPGSILVVIAEVKVNCAAEF